MKILFFQGLVIAHGALKENLKQINQINVFPVAANDIGSNLFSSIEDNHL